MHAVLYLLLFVAALFAGAQNAQAGSGSFITFRHYCWPAWARARPTSPRRFALFPGQLTAQPCSPDRRSERALPRADQPDRQRPRRAAASASAAAAAAGDAGPLLSAGAVPRVVAPGVCAQRNVLRRNSAGAAHRSPRGAAFAQFGIAIYGGFGGWIGMLMLAALTLAGWPAAPAAATKERACRRDERLCGVDFCFLTGRALGGRPGRHPRCDHRRTGGRVDGVASERKLRAGDVVLDVASRSGCLSNKSFFFGEESGAGPGAAAFFAATRRRLHSPAFFDVGFSFGRSACSRLAQRPPQAARP